MGGDITITLSDVLTDVSGFGALTRVDGDITITLSDGLTDVSGFGAPQGHWRVSPYR